MAQQPASQTFRAPADTVKTTRMRNDYSFSQCPPVNLALPSTCVVIDATRSVDSLAGPMVFRWQMGDGQTREGVKFDYCYAKVGRYKVQLDVVDERTGETRQHEAEYIIELDKPLADLAFDAPASAHVGEPVVLQLLTDRLPACVNREKLRFNWDFRDGYLGQGLSTTHIWRRAGTFTVRLSVDGTGLGADCLPRQCVTREVIVEP